MSKSDIHDRLVIDMVLALVRAAPDASDQQITSTALVVLRLADAHAANMQALRGAA